MKKQCFKFEFLCFHSGRSCGLHSCSMLNTTLQVHRPQSNASVVFFFFHWHYSPLWALACWTMSFHFFLSATNSLHLLTPSTWRSLSTSSFHFFLGLPLFLVPSVLEWSSFWASYRPPFSLGDLTSLSFALLSILLYFHLCSPLLVLDSSDFSIPRFHNIKYYTVFYKR